MAILHVGIAQDGRIRHWANEIDDEESEEYEIPTFYIRQVETGAEYYDAVDNFPCRYTYEATDKPIPSEDPTEVS